MPIIRRDLNELRYNSLWLLPKQGNPDYYLQLIKNFKGFCYGMGAEEYVDELETIIKEKLEKPMGTSIQHLLLVYKNLPTLNSFTRSKNPAYRGMNVYKYTIQKWLDEMEEWIMHKVIELEPDIRFTTPARQYI